MIVIRQRRVGSTASAECTGNYRIQGDRRYNCSRSGEWVGSAQCGKYGTDYHGINSCIKLVTDIICSYNNSNY